MVTRNDALIAFLVTIVQDQRAKLATLMSFAHLRNIRLTLTPCNTSITKNGILHLCRFKTPTKVGVSSGT
jgi:hypothetical protein